MMRKTVLLVPLAAFLTSLLAGCGPTQPAGQAKAAASAEVPWLTDYDAVLKLAKSTNKPIAMDFFATWCGPCRMMERDTFGDEKVQKRLADFVPLKVDVDRQRELAARYGIEGMPTTIAADANGKVLAKAVGYLAADRYLALLDSAKASGAVSQAAIIR
jgi:thiol:disulfide interchange protein